MFKIFARWMAYDRTIRELDRLSVRELNDIGLCHGDIQRVAREVALEV